MATRSPANAIGERAQLNRSPFQVVYVGNLSLDDKFNLLGRYALPFFLEALRNRITQQLIRIAPRLALHLELAGGHRTTCQVAAVRKRTMTVVWIAVSCSLVSPTRVHRDQ